MKARRFIQCDVFSPVPLQGNGLAVVVDADGLSDEQMQRFASWTNLAETTFLLPPTDLSADYRVRIFTPVREMPFAGHPTLGSCASWLHTGGKPKVSGIVRQECGVGIVEIDISQAPNLSFSAPPTTIKQMDPAHRLDILRTLAPSSGMSEDPITGSLNAAIAKWMLAARRLQTPYFVAQGTSIGRLGRVAVKAGSDGAVWIGGQVHVVIEGHVNI
jgi:predicted PhzF superfamily epimerase YddE/YHI9